MGVKEKRLSLQVLLQLMQCARIYSRLEIRCLPWALNVQRTPKQKIVAGKDDDACRHAQMGGTGIHTMIGQRNGMECSEYTKLHLMQRRGCLSRGCFLN